MKVIYLSLVIWTIVGIKHQVQKQNLLIGAWDSQDRSGLKLFFSENTLKETYPDRMLEWEYRMLEDTLILLNGNAGTQKHIIGELTDKKLKLKPVKLNQVDIPLIDHVEFFREK